MNINYFNDRVPIQSIDPGGRARKEYEDIDDLAFEIKEHGLINPLTVVNKDSLDDEALQEQTNKDCRYLLIAGGRRLAACKEAGIDSIPVRMPQGTFNKEQLKVLELHENIYRKPLTWHEESTLKKEIHELQVGIAKEEGQAKPHSIRDTSKVLGESHANTARDLELAEAMEYIPELKECKTKDEAYKKLKKLKKEAAHQVFAERKEKEESKTDDEQKKKDLTKQYIVGDFFKGVKQIPDETIHFVELDPPYAIDLVEKKREGSYYTDSYNEVPADVYEGFMKQTFKECYRVMKPKSWIICWFAPDPWYVDIKRWMEEAGFNVRGVPVVWSKGVGQTNYPEYHLASSHEMFFYASKGDATIIKRGSLNVLPFRPIGHQAKIHPTERPIELMEYVLRLFSVFTNNVLVPFGGSGNTVLAASNLGIKAKAFELSKSYKNSFDTKVWEGEYGKYRSYKNGE